MTGLKVSGVCKSYAQKQVVNDISFEAKAGEILGFLGPNGAGKTTTIRMIMGITAPDRGEISFFGDGLPLSGIPQAMVGYLPEERGLYKEARVLSILSFLAGLKGVPAKTAKERALVWLDKFGLKDNANSKIEELSKGMAQKVQFIGCVLHEPKFIIMDEPFSGLDPVSQDVFKAEIKAIAAAGATIILSSHQMNIMEELCDRIFLIHKGKQVFHGTLAEIKERYGSYRVELNANTEDGLSFVANSASISSFEHTGEGKVLCHLKENLSLTDFLAEIPKQTKLTELNAARTSLHDIFVKIAMGAENEK